MDDGDEDDDRVQLREISMRHPVSIGDETIYLHGTRRRELKSILEHGLCAPKCGDLTIKKSHEGSCDEGIYFTNDPERADYWAWSRQMGIGEHSPRVMIGVRGSELKKNQCDLYVDWNVLQDIVTDDPEFLSKVDGVLDKADIEKEMDAFVALNCPCIPPESIAIIYELESARPSEEPVYKIIHP